MIKIATIIIFCLIVAPKGLFACLDAGYYKIFPLAIVNVDEIISFDVDVHRSGIIDQPTDERFSWRLEINLVHYNNEQKLIKKIPFDTLFYKGENYAVMLSYYLGSRIKSFKKFQPWINWLSPRSISFCNYQKSCADVAFHSEKNKDWIRYNDRNYPLLILKDEAKYSRGFDDYSSDIFYMNSVRLFQANGKKLLVVHMQTGHEISLGYYDKNSSDYIKPLEYVPNFPFNELKTSIYFEPIMHHGFGTDVFVFVD